MKYHFALLLVLSFLTSFGQNVENKMEEPPPAAIYGKSKDASVNKKTTKYVDAGCFSEGLAPIMTGNGKWGFIDTKGKLVILPKYDGNLALGFKNGACVVFQDRKLAVIDKQGNNLGKEGYAINPVGSNYATVTKEGKIGLIDFSGQTIIAEGIYNQIWYIETLNLFKVVQNGKVGYLDINGNTVFAPKYSFLDFENTNDPSQARIGEKFGFVDFKGNELTPFKYDYTKSFSEGFARVGSNGKYGFINKKGEEIIALKYEKADDFSEGLASVKLNDKWGVINSKGKLVIPAIYDDISEFHKGLAIAKKSEKYGVIDNEGKTVIPFEYEYIQESLDKFTDTIANDKSCFIVEKNKKKGLVDGHGKKITSVLYDDIFNLDSQRTLLILNNKSALLNRSTGKMIVGFKYDFIYPFISENTMYVSNNDKFGFIDIDGNEIIPLIYDGAKNFSEGLAAVILNWEVYFINKENKIVIKPVVPEGIN